jgi:hypothetical protein
MTDPVPSRPQTGIIALLILALSAGAGCVNFGAETPLDGGSCVGDACQSSLICTADGSCYAPQPTSTSFGVEVLPKETGAAQEFKLAGAGKGNTDLQLIPTVMLSGRVLLTSSLDGASVTAKVIATRKSDLAGRPDVVTSVDSMPGIGPDQVSYQLPLLSGKTYDIRVIPGDGVSGAAPAIVRGVSLDHDEPKLDLHLPDGNNALRVQGAVLSATAEQLTGARVTAHDPVTDELVSSVATTSRGSFVLAVRPDDQLTSIVLRIEPPENTTKPTVDIGPLALPTAGAPLLLDAINLPAQQGVLQRITQVSGKGPDGVDQPVSGAVVTYSAEAMDTIALSTGMVPRLIRYQAIATTDDAGESMVDLIKGQWTYRMLVVPPTGSPYRVYTEEPVVVENAGVGPAVELLPKPELVGVVTGPDGLPVPNVVIDAQVVLPGAAPYGLEAWLNNPAGLTVTTDMAGGYRMALDPLGDLGDGAAYTLTLRPPDGSGLPRTAYEGVKVTDQAEQMQNLQVARPSLVQGQLLDAGGMPVSDAQLRFYLLGNTADGTATAKLISEGTVTDGGFRLIVPDQPAQLEP